MPAVSFLATGGLPAVSWIHPEPGFMERAGHAVLAGGGVWVIDPPDGDGVEERIRALGPPAGVVQLLDRHPRDNAALADRLGVPLHVLPQAPPPGAPWTPLDVLSIPGWREVGLWFGEHRLLVVAESLCAGVGYSAPGERVGLHPLRRVFSPDGLRHLDVEHLLLGHGEGVHGRAEVTAALDAAFVGAVRRLPSLALRNARRALPF